MVSMNDTRQKVLHGSIFLLQKVRFAQKLAHRIFDIFEFFMHNRLSSYKYNIVSAFHDRNHRAERFPQPTFDAVAHNAVSDFFADRNTYMKLVRVVSREQQHHQPAAFRLSGTVYVPEFFVSF